MSDLREKYIKTKEHLFVLLSDVSSNSPEGLFLPYIDEWIPGRNKDFDETKIFNEMIEVIKGKTNFQDVLGVGFDLFLESFDRDPTILLTKYPRFNLLTEYVSDNGETFIKGNMDRHLMSLRRLKRGDMRNTWVSVCRSLYDSAYFSLNYKDKIHEHFEKEVYSGENLVENCEWVNGKCNPEMSYKAISIVRSEIFGIGFSLASEFAVRMGFPWFIRPNEHFITMMQVFTGRKNSYVGEIGYQNCIKDGILISNEIGIHPHALDRIMFLTFSGNLYKDALSLSGTPVSRMKSLIAFTGGPT